MSGQWRRRADTQESDGTLRVAVDAEKMTPDDRCVCVVGVRKGVWSVICRPRTNYFRRKPANSGLSEKMAIKRM